jgi:hypothetical protein
MNLNLDRYRVRLTRPGWLATLLLTLLPAVAWAQEPDSSWKIIRSEGVLRASALVDSVFVDRQLPAATVDGGDFAAYLMARLGATNLPPDFNYRVAIDSTQIRLGGKLSELPPEAKRSLSQLMSFFPPDSRLEAQITLHGAGKQAVRFHLNAVSINGTGVPEMILQPLLTNIGRQYPALTATGRDLYVQVPDGATIQLVDGGVRLVGPPPR